MLVAPYGVADAEKRLAAENALRTTMAAVLGGIAVAAGSIVAALNLAHNRRVLEVTQRGQVTERFSKAIEHLGQSDGAKLELRIGAVYALEQIATDSAELHWPIMEILTAYLREHTRWVGLDAEVAEVREGNDGGQPAQTPVDVQAIATVIGRRQLSQDPYGRRLDLHGVNLSHVQWAEAQLARADLSGAQLKGAYLRAAQLKGAYLVEAKLRRANLSWAHLEGANLSGATLEGANLFAAHLEGALLIGAQLEGVNLSGATLEGAFLGGAQLKGANLRQAQLEGAHLRAAQLEGPFIGAHPELEELHRAQFEVLLSGAHLDGAYLPGVQLEALLSGATLEGADLSAAHLEGANLSGVQLEGADLGGAYLEGADLSGARLERANLSGAHLEGANLSGAHLEGANLSDARLEGANLSGVDLIQVTGLTWSILRLAKSFDRSRVPHSVRQEAERGPNVQPADN